MPILKSVILGGKAGQKERERAKEKDLLNYRMMKKGKGERKRSWVPTLNLCWMLMGTIPADVPFQAVLSQHTTLGCFREAYSNQNFATAENLRCSRLMVGANPASDMLQCVPDGLFYLKAGAKAPCTHRPFPQAANHKQQGVQTGNAEKENRRHFRGGTSIVINVWPQLPGEVSKHANKAEGRVHFWPCKDLLTHGCCAQIYYGSSAKSRQSSYIDRLAWSKKSFLLSHDQSSLCERRRPISPTEETVLQGPTIHCLYLSCLPTALHFLSWPLTSIVILWLHRTVEAVGVIPV